MKKIFFLITLCAASFGSLSAQTNYYNESKFDVNCNGYVNTQDIDIINDYITGKLTGFTNPIFWLDINGDNKIDVADVTTIVKFLDGNLDNKARPKNEYRQQIYLAPHATLWKSPLPNWKNSSDTYHTFMNVFVDQSSMPTDLAIGANDVLVAFINGECRGYATPNNDSGAWRFQLHIVGAENDPANSDVEFRYYSASYESYLVSYTVKFKESEVLGKASAGYQLTWKWN